MLILSFSNDFFWDSNYMSYSHKNNLKFIHLMYSASLRNHGFFGLNSPYLCAQIKVDFETDHESQNQIIFYVVRDLLA